MSESFKRELIQLTLSLAVPSCIANLQRIGGPSDWHFEQAHVFAGELGAHGDAILYHVKGETARMMTRLCEAVAVLAFCPGGVTTFGLHFEAHAESEVRSE